MRRGMSGPGMIGALILLAVIIVLAITFLGGGFKAAGDDLTALRGCEARAAQGGGRGVCDAVSSACESTAVTEQIKRGEYASYLGFRCGDADEGVVEDKRPYCCIILPNSRNPPSGDRVASAGSPGAVGTV